MIVSTVRDILAASDGTAVEAFTGIIVKAFPQKGGTNDKGQWSVQNLEVASKKGDQRTATVSLWNRVKVGEGEAGQSIYLVANGPGNLKVSDRVSKGKTYRSLSVAKEAEMTIGGEAQSDEQPPAPPARQAPTTQSAPPLPAQAPAKKSDPVSAAKTFVARQTNGWLICFHAAKYVWERVNREDGIPLTEEQTQALVSTLFIAANRAGMFDDLPAKPIEFAKPKAPVPPAPASEPDPEPDGEPEEF